MPTLQGHLLIASPKLADPNFQRAVILIVQHGDEGAMGVILNRPLPMLLSQAWSQVSQSPCLIEAALYQGGPVEGPLMAVHTRPEHAQIEVLHGISFSTNAPSITALVESAASPTKFLVGYAGWTAGQLEMELAQDAWLVTAARPTDIFETPDWAVLAKRAVRRTIIPAIDPKLLPEDPSLN